ncbi:MAG: hypothetical protein ACXVZX_05145 [Terriglobales bacterium]
MQSPPHRGQLLRDYELTKADGTTFLLSDFRGKQNLVLLLFPERIEVAHAQLLRDLAEKSGEVRENETRVIVVVRPEQLQAVQAISEELTAATGDSGNLFAELAPDSEAAIYLTDKFREVFHVYRVTTDAAPPSADDIVGWIKFVAMNCPECHPPEWPADTLD